MEKNKLFEARKSKGLSQLQIAQKLNMDHSSYQRREKGQIKIHITEWEKLSKILEVPLEEIFESEESQVFIWKDNASGNYQPEFCLRKVYRYSNAVYPLGRSPKI